MQFTVDETSGSTTNLVITGEASADAAAFTTADYGLSSRPRTVNQTNWSPPPWNSVDDAEAAQRTPNLTAIIDEIINAPGWARGNSLVLLINGSGERTAEAEDGDADDAAVLHIDYLEASP